MRMDGRRARWIAGAGIGTAAALGGSATAQAADFTVTSLADDGSDGTLRTEVADALAAGAGNHVVFNSGLSGTITLESGDIDITDGLSIDGPGGGAITVDAHNASRHFYVPYSAAGEDVTIAGLTLIDGRAAGMLNTDKAGGSILVRASTFTLSDAVISGSTATSFGGGVCISEGDPDQYGAHTVIENSTISGNTASGLNGGGIYSRWSFGTVRNSTVTGNTAVKGGGLYGYSNDSFSPYTSHVESSTIAGNTATSSGGGLSFYHYDYYGHGPSSMTVKNTVIADNTAPSAPDVKSNASGPLATSFSLIENPAGATITNAVADSNITGEDPGLGALEDNGGPTPTMLPATDSPVVDQGSSGGLTTDQRGEARPFDVPGVDASAAPGADSSDMGAVELGTADLPQPPTVTISHDPPIGLTGEPVTFTADASDPDGTIDPADIAWDLDDDGAFDDGTGTSVQHALATAGDYTVHVQVTDADDQTATDDDSVTVEAAPEASFTFDPSAPQTGQSITFTSTSQDPDGTIDPSDILWDLDHDGAYDDGSGTSVQHAFDTAGSHTVGLQVTDSDGHMDTASEDVAVTAPQGGGGPGLEPSGPAVIPPAPQHHSKKAKCKKKKSKKKRKKCLKKLKKKKG